MKFTLVTKSPTGENVELCLQEENNERTWFACVGKDIIRRPYKSLEDLYNALVVYGDIEKDTKFKIAFYRPIFV